MRSLLRWLALLTGVACAAIGVYHFSLGVWSVPGGRSAGATVDSRERFYNAIFFGYGVAWVWAARQRPLPLTLIRGLAALMFLGGIGRLISLAVWGRPHWFQQPLTVIEIVLPLLLFWLSRPTRVAGDTSS